MLYAFSAVISTNFPLPVVYPRYKFPALSLPLTPAAIREDCLTAASVSSIITGN